MDDSYFLMTQVIILFRSRTGGDALTPHLTQRSGPIIQGDV